VFSDTGVSDNYRSTDLPMVGTGQSPLERALYLFRRQKNPAFLRRLWIFLIRRSARLRSYDEAVAGVRIEDSHCAGARPVPIDKMRGSLGKTGKSLLLFRSSSLCSLCLRPSPLIPSGTSSGAPAGVCAVERRVR
jgi:hypothetical protein